MSTFGAVQVINTQSRPQLVALSTKQGQQCDSTLSDVTWTMQDKIAVEGINFTAVASLYSMIFTNTFANITKANQKLKFLSVYTVNGTVTSNILTTTLPTGHYDINSLINYLNTPGVCNSTDGSGFIYGFGNVASANVVATPPFAVSASDPAKITFTLPSGGDLAGTPIGALGVYNASHIYTGFYMIVDAETIPLMDTMGFLVYDQSKNIINTTTTLGMKTIGFPVFNGGSGSYYTFTEPYVTPTTILLKTGTGASCINLGGPTAITLSWESMNTNTRLSTEDLTIGDCMAVIPVTAAYGYKVVYQPTLPFRCTLPNFNINRFQLKVKNADTGEYVDFQNSGWMATFNIEFFEVENNNMSEQALSGVGRTVMPTLHGVLYDHTLPNSGTSGYRDSAKRHRPHR